MPPSSSGPPGGLTTWRVFPWDASAPDGAPYSPRSVPPPHRQQYGRFDLGGRPPVVYLAETPSHAVAEVFRGLSGQTVTTANLRSASGHPYAVVEVVVPEAIVTRCADLNDPAVLARHAIAPDALASANRARSQPVARTLHAAGLHGFRWWSALHGDWHARVLFLDRVSLDELGYGEPRVLGLGDPEMAEAARVLRITLS